MHTGDLKCLPAERDYLAPDGSEIRLLVDCAAGGLAHCLLYAGATTAPVAHRTVDELWFVLDGDGELLRGYPDGVRVDPLHRGVSVRIPVGVPFQFRAAGQDLRILIATMPPWPGSAEAQPVDEKWRAQFFAMRAWNPVSSPRSMGDLPEVDALESTVETLLGDPPDVDPLAMERARARAEARLFGMGAPGRIGRYEIIDPIGGGGMGMVYSAYDPQLQRKVALKILHPQHYHDARSHQRMILEARALAKLDHPNVVKVHDVMVENQQVVVVMELLEGQTLEHWQAHAPRTWREIVAVYAQAGDGLVAAHGVEVVHRDFKPSNAIIGAHGRVRVVDFGLARLAGDPDPIAGDRVLVPSELTATGDVLGTLAYSAPEQLAGRTATPASDQFSFCVALHVAIEGTSPFTGADPVERGASIQRGNVARATDGRRVPPWLRAVIARGLAAEPRDRYPTLRDVVRELRRARGWRRWRLPVLGAAALAATIASTGLVARGAGTPTCAGEAELVQGAWNSAVRDQIQGAIQATGTPYAVAVRDRVLRTLDRYATEWRATHHTACRAHQRGETSAVLFDRQTVCLTRRLGDLRAAAGVLAKVDAGTLANAMDVASAIPGAAMCADLEQLQGDVAPPATPAVRMQVEAVRAQISSAEALARAGRSELALTTLTEARAIATPYPPVQVEAALAEGRIHLAQHDLQRAIATLVVARKAALEQQMLAAALEASARIIYAEGQLSPQLDRLQRELDYLLPLSAGLRGDYVARPLLLNNVGTVYLAAGRRADAARYFEDAKAELRRHDPANLELTNVDLNLAMITSDAPKRETLARSVWDKLRDVLGEQHRSTIDALIVYALYVSDPAVALEALERAAAAYGEFHPTAVRQIALVEAKRAFLAAELGEPRATALYRSAIAKLDVKAGGEIDDDLVQQRRLCSGELALLLGEPQRAIDEFLPVYNARIHSSNWWERADALRAAVGLGQAAAAVHNRALAIQYLDSAVRDYAGVLAVNEEVENRRYLARARHGLAQVLDDPARARSLEQEAREFYRAAGATSYR